MITDKIENLHHYNDLHPNFASLFNILQSLNLDYMELGHIEIDGKYIYINVEKAATNPPHLESHQRYIDIHIPLDSDEQIDIRPTSECTQPLDEYDSEKDVQFFADQPTGRLTLKAKEHFAILFPADAHRPAISQENHITKMIVKVSVEPNSEKPTL